MRPRNRLRELRKRAGLRQEDLAEQSGISQAAISQLENDQRPLTLDYMRTFARIMGCTAADLLDDADNPDRLRPDEVTLVNHYRSADPTHQAMVRRVAEPVARHDIEPADPALHRNTRRRAS